MKLKHILAPLALTAALYTGTAIADDKISELEKKVEKEFTAKNVNDLAAEYIEEKEYAKAEEILERAIENGHETSGVYTNLSSAQGFLGKWGECKTNAEKAIGRNYFIAEAHYNLGTAYHVQGSLLEAAKELALAQILPYNDHETPGMIKRRLEEVLDKLSEERGLRIEDVEYKPTIQGLVKKAIAVFTDKSVPEDVRFEQGMQYIDLARSGKAYGAEKELAKVNELHDALQNRLKKKQ